MENNFSKSDSGSMSEDIRQLAQSFALAKKLFIATGKSATNDHQKYKYAKIEDIYNAVEAGLLANNIIIWHFCAIADDTTEILRTRLIHTLSGQYVQDSRILVSEKPGNQAKGAANTYMRKYAVLCLCAIATEDDDGEEEEKYIVEEKIITKKTKDVNYAVVTPEQLDMLFKETKSFTPEENDRLKAKYAIEKYADLPKSAFEDAIDRIRDYKMKLSK